MFCQWCGKERDANSNAIHHCGAKDRPAAFCMQCGAAFQEGDVACRECSTPVGQEPVLVAAAAPPIASTDPAEPVDAMERSGPVPRVASAPGSLAPSRASTRQTMVRVSQDSPSDYLRKGQMMMALVGTLAFFIPWAENGFSGISAVTQASWTWWNPPAAQLLFSLLLIALALSFLGRNAAGNGVSALVALIGLALVIFCCDWLWRFRHVLNLLTGFYIVVAACVLLSGFAAASMRADART